MVELFQGVYGVRPHKEKINISKEIINKTRGAEAPYVVRIYRKRRRRESSILGAEAPYVARMNHTPLRGEQQATVL